MNSGLRRSPKFNRAHRVLKPTGSLYLHCDPTASHYIKIVLDAIFGPVNFKNEIVWKRSDSHPLSINKFEAITDTILFYWKSSGSYFSSVTKPIDQANTDRDYRHVDKHGRHARKDLSGGKRGGKEAYMPFKGTLPPRGRAWAPPTREKLPQWARNKIPDDYERLNQLEKCEELDKAGLIYWSKNKKPYFKRYLPENHTKFVPSLVGRHQAAVCNVQRKTGISHAETTGTFGKDIGGFVK